MTIKKSGRVFDQKGKKMSFDFNAEKRAAEEEAAENKWDKARLWREKIIFCISLIEEIDNPWFDEKKANDAPTCYQFSLRFVADGQRQTMTTTYKISPDMRILVGKHPVPWHNMLFLRYQAKSGSYGYELSQHTTDDSACPWERHSVKVTPAQAIAAPAENMPSESVDAVLTGMGFEPSPPITEAQQQQLLTLSARVMTLSGKRIDPGNFETMTSGDAEAAIARFNNYIGANRAIWLQQSASKAKTDFSS